MTDPTAEEPSTPARSHDGRDPARSVATAWSDRFGRFSIRALQVLIVAALVVAVLNVVGLLRLIVIPVVLALLLSAAFAPLVGLLRKRLHFPRALAAATALILAVLVLAGVITLVVQQVQRQASTLAKSANDGIGQIQSFLTGPPLNLDASAFSKLRQSATDFISSPSVGSGALAGVAGLVDFVTTLFVLIVTLFFFLKDGRQMWEFLLKPLDPGRTRRARRIGDAALDSLGGYVRGTALVALVDAVVIGAGLFILQIPLALPLAVIVFLTAFIPIVGATVAGVLAALVALVTNGLGAAVWVVVIVFAVNQLEGNLLQPFIMGRSVRLHPIVILIALIVGSILAGIIGAIVAVPVAAVIWDAMKLWDTGDDEPQAVARAADG